jgi:hypothetical protein
MLKRDWSSRLDSSREQSKKQFSAFAHRAGFAAVRMLMMMSMTQQQQQDSSSRTVFQPSNFHRIISLSEAKCQTVVRKQKCSFRFTRSAFLMSLAPSKGHPTLMPS